MGAGSTLRAVRAPGQAGLDELFATQPWAFSGTMPTLEESLFFKPMLKWSHYPNSTFRHNTTTGRQVKVAQTTTRLSSFRIMIGGALPCDRPGPLFLKFRGGLSIS